MYTKPKHKQCCVQQTGSGIKRHRKEVGRSVTHNGATSQREREKEKEGKEEKEAVTAQ